MVKDIDEWLSRIQSIMTIFTSLLLSVEFFRDKKRKERSTPTKKKKR